MYTQDTETVARTTTDEGGRFTFRDLSPGQWSVGPAPSNSRSEPRGVDDVAPVGTEVSILEGAHTVEVELRLYRGLFIRGEVLRPDGERTESARVMGVCRDSGVWAMSQAQDGLFSLGPLTPGSYVLTASRKGLGGPGSDPVTARAGDVDIVLQLWAMGSIQGKLVDASSGEPVLGQARLSLRVGSRKTWISAVGAESDGRFRFDGLSPGDYDVSGTSGNLVGRVQNVVVGPSQSVLDLEVLLEPAAILLVTYTGEGENLLYHVRSGESQLHLAGLTRGRTSRVLLPAGRVVVILEFTSADGAQHQVQRTVDLVVGEETQVEVGEE